MVEKSRRMKCDGWLSRSEDINVRSLDQKDPSGGHRLGNLGLG
jgi:hypothetical protein